MCMRRARWARNKDCIGELARTIGRKTNLDAPCSQNAFVISAETEHALKRLNLVCSALQEIPTRRFAIAVSAVDLCGGRRNVLTILQGSALDILRKTDKHEWRSQMHSLAVAWGI